MFQTPNIGLEVWDLNKDDFSHLQLTDNWVALDNHDHSPGHGARIGTSSISSKAITTPLIANEAITTPLYALRSIGSEQISEGGVTTESLANGAVTTAKIATHGVTYEKLDPTVQPLGTMVPWYRQVGDSRLPGGGWEICDGRPWSEITNSLGYTSGHIPDLRNCYVIGADINGVVGPAIGESVGSNTKSLAHSHTVNAHTHGIVPHVHGIAEDGVHHHTFTGGDEIRSRPNVFASGVTVEDVVTKTQKHNTNQSAYVGGFNTSGEDAAAPMDNAGGHSHGGATSINTEVASGSSSPGTNSQLGSVDLRPSSQAMLWIMRVR